MIFLEMSINWRECEHSAIDNELMEDKTSLDVLRNCGLLKFFKMPNMKINVRLLQMLVDHWELEEDYFIIDQMPIHIEM